MESIRRLKYSRIKIRNRFFNLFSKAEEHKFLFILCPPYCGSTALNEVLSTAGSVSVNNPYSTREGQQLPEIRSIMFDGIDRWDESLEFPWPKIRETWLKYWDLRKPVLLEKSPPNIIRAETLEEHFSPSHFIAMVRNPYAHVEGTMRRHQRDAGKTAEFAIRCLRVQKSNLDKLSNTILITYEELTETPEKVAERLGSFLSELKNIDTSVMLKAHNLHNQNMKLTNLNAEKIKNISEQDLAAINVVFEKNRDILDYFGYELIT